MYLLAGPRGVVFLYVIVRATRWQLAADCLAIHEGCGCACEPLSFISPSHMHSEREEAARLAIDCTDPASHCIHFRPDFLSADRAASGLAAAAHPPQSFPDRRLKIAANVDL